ncbi:hypothetical protein ACWGLF_44295 [Streptomyces puniciscabiei]
MEGVLQRGIRQGIGHWSGMRHGGRPLCQGLRKMGGDLLGLAAARTLEDPALDTPRSREVLLTAAECAFGELRLGCFPEGGWDVLLLLVGETLTGEEMHFEETWEPACPSTTAHTWVKAFALCVISGLIGERSRVIGPLQEDYAPAIRDAVPYSKRESVSAPADLAEMDALCNYLTLVHRRCPGALLGPVPLHRAGTEARARASTRLDAAGALDPTSGCCAFCSTTASPSSNRPWSDGLWSTARVSAPARSRAPCCRPGPPRWPRSSPSRTAGS